MERLITNLKEGTETARRRIRRRAAVKPLRALSLAETLRRPGATLTILAVPFIVFIAVFSYLPLVGWVLAFLDYRPGLPLTGQRFVGFFHFDRIFTAGLGFWEALRNTFVLSLLGILVSPLPALFALLLNEVRSRKLSRFIQSVTSLPNFISWVLVFAFAFLMFSVDDGMVNAVLMKTFGILKRPSNILADVNNAWIIQTLLSLWKGMGWSAIIYLAAIAGIDPQLYEAAEIDGAGRFRKALSITVPGILETYMVLLLLAVAGMLSVGFEQFWVFQNPMTISRLEVLDTYIYRMGMRDLRFDFATAVGILKTVVSVTMLFVANGISRLVRGRSII